MFQAYEDSFGEIEKYLETKMDTKAFQDAKESEKLLDSISADLEVSSIFAYHGRLEQKSYPPTRSTDSEAVGLIVTLQISKICLNKNPN